MENIKSFRFGDKGNNLAIGLCGKLLSYLRKQCPPQINLNVIALFLFGKLIGQTGLGANKQYLTDTFVTAKLGQRQKLFCVHCSYTRYLHELIKTDPGETVE